MNDRYLTLKVEYNLKKDIFHSSGDLNLEGKIEVVETFLRGQIGAGRDNNKPFKREKYNIQLKWYPSDDRIESTSNTGNNSLRDGLLLQFLRSLYIN